MPGCVLRVEGEEFQPDIFLKTSTFEPCNVFKKGKRKSKNSIWETSGFTVVVSDTIGNEFHQQVTDAIAFIKINQPELLRLRNFIGLKEISLDFGVYAKDGFLQSYFFPSALVLLAGQLEIALEVSIYSAN